MLKPCSWKSAQPGGSRDKQVSFQVILAAFYLQICFVRNEISSLFRINASKLTSRTTVINT